MIIPEHCIFCHEQLLTRMLPREIISGEMTLFSCNDMYQGGKHEGKMFWFYKDPETMLSLNIAINSFCVTWDFQKDKTTIRFNGNQIAKHDHIIQLESFDEKFIVDKIKFLSTFW